LFNFIELFYSLRIVNLFIDKSFPKITIEKTKVFYPYSRK